MEKPETGTTFLPYEPLLIIISGVSGIGKDTTARRLMQRDHPFHFVITATDRPKRRGERDGVDYLFVTTARFEEMIANDELLEHSTVYEQNKGVPKEQIRKALASGKDVIMRLDVQGAAKIRAICPAAITIFLAPENREEWLQRLARRDSESEEDLQIRIEKARSEMEKMHEFDYIVINAKDQLDKTVDTIMAIITAEHHRAQPRGITL